MLKVRPSALHRIFECPSSLLHQDSYENEETPYSIEGTKKHQEMQQAFLLQNESHTDLKILKDEIQSKVCNDFRYHQAFSEIKLIKNYKDFQLVGTCDFIYSYSHEKTVHILIVDFKFGYQKVEVKNNPQLLAYALLARGDAKDIEITIGIYQDRKLEIQKVTDSDLKKFEKKLLKVIDISKKSTYNATETACKYCAHRKNCDAFSEKVSTEMSLVSDKIQKNLHSDAKFEFRKQVLLNRKLLEYAIEDSENFFKKALADGVFFDFVTLQNSGKMKLWNPDLSEKDIIDVLMALDLRKQDIVESKLKSASSIANLLKDKLPENLIVEREKAKSLKLLGGSDESKVTLKCMF